MRLSDRTAGTRLPIGRRRGGDGRAGAMSRHAPRTLGELKGAVRVRVIARRCRAPSPGSLHRSPGMTARPAQTWRCGASGPQEFVAGDGVDLGAQFTLDLRLHLLPLLGGM